MTTDENKRTRLSDPEVIRALAHPARTAVLDYLDGADEATATECAKVVGLSPSAMSYHLRTLAKVGLVEEAEGRGDGRERLWRRKIKDLSVGVEYDAPASVKLTGRAMVEAFQAAADIKLRRYLDVAADEPREWYEALLFGQTSVYLTPEELREFQRKVAEALEPFSGRKERGEIPEGARKVAIQTRMFPEV
ncbi:helix-turn-helix protein [Stackebrandtia endophytica]|uniref:Helix-turn-helix protein n=1 Tax=Stackebrandtia endophytica TaxID=1496996 RepID=A0A543AV02_9ACTN|nr:helix-turn-helix domain-containing protein [Stackebrandtia endophytica]TQL76402.1 helix-turn-helix protein [Stackebrandtia endophytica]